MALWRVFVLDRLSTFRKGLVAVLGQREDVEVVGDAGVEEDALRDAPGLDPSVVVLELNTLKGLPSIDRLHEAVPNAGFIVMSPSVDDISVAQVANPSWADLLGSSVTGLIHRNADEAELVDAISNVQAGRVFLGRDISRLMLREVTTILARNINLSCPNCGHKFTDHSELTAREDEVLKLVAKGWKSRTIASHLNISEGTVKAHLGNIFKKIGVSSRVEAALHHSTRKE